MVCSRMELPCAVVGARFRERARELIMKTMAHHVVAFVRKVAAPRGPNAVWLPAPPNAPAKSAAEPLCNMITKISKRQTRTCKVTSTKLKFQPSHTSSTAAIRAITHFAVFGISTPRRPAVPWPLEIHNRGKRLRIEAGSANKRTIDRLLSHQAANIVRSDAAAIKNA
jgi:hypothetical protein